MKTRSTGEQEQLALMQGTLDVLILRTLVFGAQHGQGIARAIQDTSEDVLLVDHGALYPALQRLEAQKWITAKWGTSANNRKARDILGFECLRSDLRTICEDAWRWHSRHPRGYATK